MPPANENIFDILDELRQLIDQLRMIVYGDKTSRYPGMVDEVGRLQSRIEHAEMEIEKLKRRRPNVPLWVAGFLSFVISVSLLGVSFVNFSSKVNIFDMTPFLAAGLAVFFVAVSLVLFLGGFGWLDGQ